MKTVLYVATAIVSLICLVPTMAQEKQEKKEPAEAFPPYDQGPEAKTVVQPKYPEIATRAGLEGTVWTKVWIDETGKVTKVTVTKSDAEVFNQAAINAAMQWKFKPAQKNGKPIATEAVIPFKFGLSKGGEVSDYTKLGMSYLLVGVRPHASYAVIRQQPYLIGQSVSATSEWYPESAMKDGFDGMVMVILTVNTSGRVEQAKVESPAREDLDSAAVRLAKTWTFIPGQANGLPEKALIRAAVSFHLAKSPK